tara:strand:- start:19 stop:222 length:204 start_codon:yes stop_codon:yes gene_type:complete
MSDDRPTNERIINVSNNDGSIRGYVSDSDNVQIFAKADSNSLFPETTKFKITKITQKEENRTEEKED